MNGRTTYDPSKRLRIPLTAERERLRASVQSAEVAFASALADMRPKQQETHAGQAVRDDERDLERRQHLPFLTDATFSRIRETREHLAKVRAEYRAFCSKEAQVKP